jgi:hypothetical protein
MGTYPQRIARFRSVLTRQARILGDSVACLPRWPGHLSPWICVCARSRSWRLVRSIVFGPSRPGWRCQSDGTMASADSCRSIPRCRHRGSSWQTGRSPGVRHATFAARPPHLRRRAPCDIGLRVSWPSRPRDAASYAVPVRRAAALPAASFPRRLATPQLPFG